MQTPGQRSRGWTWLVTCSISAWHLTFNGDFHPLCKQAQLKKEGGREKQTKRERKFDHILSPLDLSLSKQILSEVDSHATTSTCLSQLYIYDGMEKKTHTHRVLESWIPTHQSTFDALHGLSPRALEINASQ